MLWSLASTEQRAEIGNLPKPADPKVWLECLGARGLSAGFPGVFNGPEAQQTLAREYGCDAVRVAQLWLPHDVAAGPLRSEDASHACRFLSRVWRLWIRSEDEVAFEQACTLDPNGAGLALKRIGLNSTLQLTSPSDIQIKAWKNCLERTHQGLWQQRPHIAVAALTEFVNEATAWPSRPLSLLGEFLCLLQPFAPMLAHELRGKAIVDTESPLPSADPTDPIGSWTWPTLNSKLLTEAALEISIQVNGKSRDKLMVSGDLSSAELEKAALSAERIIPLLRGKTVRKVVVVPRKLVNIAVE